MFFHHYPSYICGVKQPFLIIWHLECRKHTNRPTKQAGEDDCSDKEFKGETNYEK
jgi:hypothetical protein